MCKRISALCMAFLLFFSVLSACASDPEPDTPVPDSTPVPGSASVSDSSVTPADDDEKVTFTEPINASAMAKEMGLGICLGNTFDSYWLNEDHKTAGVTVIGNNTPEDYETCWGAVVTTRECIEGFKAAGFDTVRIPVYWGNMMADDGSYTISKEYTNRIKEVVGYCMDNGLYTVINIHHFDEYIIRRNSTEDCSRIFNTLWTQIANEFKDYPYNLVFEGYNEYLGGGMINEQGEIIERSRDEAYLLTNTLNQTFVDAVRATGGNNAQRVLIASGYNTNIDRTTSEEFVMPKDTASDKLMVSVHYVDNIMFWTNQIGGEDWINYIEDQCMRLKKAFTDKGIPVFMGETTFRYPAERFSSDAIYTGSAKCMEIVLNRLLDYGFIPVIWDTSNDFYSRTECAIKSYADKEVIDSIVKRIKGE